MTPRPGKGPSTVGVHSGSPDPRSDAPVVVPVYQSSTFYGGDGAGGDLLYTRYGNNPNQEEVASKVAALEWMEDAVPLASGMAATAMTLLALTRTGDHIVASEHLYGATKKLIGTELTKRGVTADFVNPEVSREWRSAIRPNTRVLFLELPTNPTLRVFDPRPLAELARQEGILLVADTTFATPVNVRARDLGIDVVIHSATKYLGGHSDLIAGVVAGERTVMGEVREMLKMYGPALDPHACWLLSRGIKTLGVRMARHNENGLTVARWLESQEGVRNVLYPGLPSHPDHQLASEILSGFGGMVSLVLEGGGRAADAFTAALRLALRAPSLGGVETLVSQPRHTSHVDQSTAERESIGIPDGFVRISLGIEDSDDLISDFDQALGHARSA